MKVAVYEAVKTVIDNTFQDGSFLGTLKSDGVRVAPFHDFDGHLSDELRSELERLKEDIIEGKVETGWSDCP